MRDVQPLCTHEQLLERLPIGIASLEGGILRYVNVAFASLHGTTVDALLGHPWIPYASPDHQTVLREVINDGSTTSSVWSGTISVQRADGVLCHLSCTVTPVDGERCDLTVQEATPIQRTRLDAVEELRVLRDVMSTTDHGYWRWSLGTDEVETSVNFLDQIGYAVEHGSPKPLSINWFFNAIHPDDLRVAEAGFERYLNGEQHCWESDVRLRGTQGEWVRTSVRGCFVGWDADGKPTVMAGTFTNIEETHAARLAADKLEQTLLSIAESLDTSLGDPLVSHPLEALTAITFERMGAITGKLLVCDLNDVGGYSCRVRGQYGRDIHSAGHVDAVYAVPANIEHQLMNDRAVWVSADPAHQFLSSVLFESNEVSTIKTIPLRHGNECVGLLVAQPSVAEKPLTLEDTIGRILLAGITRLVIEERNRTQIETLSKHHEAPDHHSVRTSQSDECTYGAADSMIAGVSHELKQPLAAILSTTETLIDGIYGELNPTQAVRIMDVHESAAHLLSMINDLLDVSKARHGVLRLEYEACDLMSVVASAITMLRPLAERKNIAVRLSSQPTEPVMIRVDPRRIRQVIVNLVGNAIKFTPDWGEVSVTLNSKDNDNVVCINVSDNGIGIDAVQLPALFEPFGQADLEGAINHEGSGLGLPIAAYIVDAHGGTVEVESTAGQGSTFTVCLPWKNQPTHPEATSSGTMQATTKGTIAVVDENGLFRAHATALLTRDGYRVNAVESSIDQVPDHIIQQADAIIIGAQVIDARVRGGIRRLMTMSESHAGIPRIIVMPAVVTPSDVATLSAEGITTPLPKALAGSLLSKQVADALNAPQVHTQPITGLIPESGA